MLHFGLNMPYYLMITYGTIMIIMVLILRLLLKNRLPKFVFPILWGIVLLRFIIPYSVSIPLSVPVPSIPYALHGNAAATRMMQVQEDTVVPGTAAYASGNVSQASDNITEYMITSNEAVSVAESTNTYAYSGEMPFSYLRWQIKWQNIIPVVYVLGIAAVAGILGRQKYNYSQKLRKGYLIEHNETVNEMLRSMDMGHVLVFTNDEIASPLVCGLLNPRIYLPTQTDFQNTLLLRHILAHETMHIKRRDNWLKCVMLAVLCLNWYNPLVWLMSSCLASDMEAACDAAVLKQCGEDEKKDYAFSLLAMAVSGRRTPLLYSAFSKTEVEKRVKNILSYKEATFFVLLLTTLFMAGSLTAFAAVGQAPYWNGLTAYCACASSKWGVEVTITRNIALGENSKERAENVVFSVLRTDNTEDPQLIEDRIRAALAEEFGVEQGAFNIMLSLCLGNEELAEEYAKWGLIKAKEGYYIYQSEPVRVYQDKMIGHYQSREEGTVDISVQRNRLGEITSITVWREGDHEFDERSGRIEQNRVNYYETGTAEQFEITAVAEDTYIIY